MVDFDDDNFSAGGGPGRAFYAARRKLGRQPNPEEVRAEAEMMKASTVTVNLVTHPGTAEELARYTAGSHGEGFWEQAHAFAWEASKGRLVDVWVDQGKGPSLEARYQDKVNITER